MKTIITCILSMSILAACDSGGGDVITTVVTSATAGPDPTNPTSDGTSTSTGAEEDPTTSGTPEDPTTSSTGTTGDDDFICVDGDKFPCEQAPVARDFCSYIADKCSEHEIEPVYCSVLADKCPRTLSCTMCFELSNFCHQLGTDCDDLYLECGCVADALGDK